MDASCYHSSTYKNDGHKEKASCVNVLNNSTVLYYVDLRRKPPKKRKGYIGSEIWLDRRLKITRETWSADEAAAIL